MRDDTYSKILSILFVTTSGLSFLYLSTIFSSTNFLQETKTNSLIPIIITFFLGVGLKSVYTFFMSALILYSDDYEEKHKFTVNIIDFITALTFFSYILNVVNNKYLLPIIILVSTVILITTLITQIYSYPNIKTNIKKGIKKYKNKSK